MTVAQGTTDFTGVFAVWRWTCHCETYSADMPNDFGTFSTRGDASDSYKEHRRSCKAKRPKVRTGGIGDPSPIEVKENP